MTDKKLTDKEVCPYCHQDNEGYVKMFGRFYLRKDHFNGWNLYAGKGKPLPIKFCPICGRLLETKQTQVYSIQDDFCGVPCKFMQDKINSLQTENEELKTQVSFLLRTCERVDKRIKTAEERMRKKIADRLTTILLKAIEVDDK